MKTEHSRRTAARLGEELPGERKHFNGAADEPAPLENTNPRQKETNMTDRCETVQAAVQEAEATVRGTIPVMGTLHPGDDADAKTHRFDRQCAILDARFNRPMPGRDEDIIKNDQLTRRAEA